MENQKLIERAIIDLMQYQLDGDEFFLRRAIEWLDFQLDAHFPLDITLQ